MTTGIAILPRNAPSIGCTACRRLFSSHLRYLRHRHDYTLRERQVVDLVCRAKSNKEIAFELGLGIESVRQYLNRIYRKRNLHSRTELIVGELEVKHALSR